MSSLHLQCPLCTGALEIDPAHLGQQVQCPLCHGLLQLPTAEALGMSTDAAPPPPPEFGPPPSLPDFSLPPPSTIGPPSAPAGDVDWNAAVSLGCPVCQQPFQVTIALAGQTVACPHCQQPVGLPPPEDFRQLLAPAAPSAPMGTAVGPSPPMGAAVSSAPMGTAVSTAPMGTAVNSVPMGAAVSPAPMGTAAPSAPLPENLGLPPSVSTAPQLPPTTSAPPTPPAPVPPSAPAAPSPPTGRPKKEKESRPKEPRPKEPAPAPEPPKEKLPPNRESLRQILRPGIPRNETPEERRIRKEEQRRRIEAAKTAIAQGAAAAAAPASSPTTPTTAPAEKPLDPEREKRRRERHAPRDRRNDLPPPAVGRADLPPSTGAADIDFLLPPTASPSAPRTIVDLTPTTGPQTEADVFLPPTAAGTTGAVMPGEERALPDAPVSVPGPTAPADGRSLVVRETTKTLGHGDEEVELRKLTSDEKMRRRAIRNFILSVFCLSILGVVLYIMLRRG